MAYTIIAILAALGIIGGVGGLYIHLAQRADRHRRSIDNLWKQTKFIREQQMDIYSRLHELEKHLPGTIASEQTQWLHEITHRDNKPAFLRRQAD